MKFRPGLSTIAVLFAGILFWQQVDAGEMLQLKAGQAYVSVPRGTGPFPAVLVVPDQAGLNPYYISEMDRLSANGILAIGVDFLRGKSAKNEKEYQELLPKFEASYAEKVVQAGFELLKVRKDILPGKFGVLGFAQPGQMAFKSLKNNDVQVGVFISIPPVLNAQDLGSFKTKIFLVYASQYPDIPRSYVTDFEKILDSVKKPEDIHFIKTDRRRWWDYAMKDSYEIRVGNETRQYILDTFLKELGGTRAASERITEKSVTVTTTTTTGQVPEAPAEENLPAPPGEVAPPADD